MSFIQQFFTSRDNNANAETFVGQEGRLWFDPVTNQIYSSDGNTPGGIPLAGGGGGNGTPGGINGQVQFNQAGSFGGTANLTINTATGALSAVSFVGNGAPLTNITGANVTGTVADATHAGVADSANSVAGGNVSGAVANATYATSAGSATTADTVTTNAQPNITSVGTLTSVSVSGNVQGGNLRTTGVVSALGRIISSNEIYSATQLTGGNISGANIVANGYLCATGNITTPANIASGNLSATGSINLAGQISAVGNITGGNLLTGANVSATGNVTGGNVISNGLITTVSNVVANYFVGNGAALYSITGANVTGTVANATYAVSAGSATTAATVTTNAQPNITSVGTLTSIASSGNISTTGNVTADYFIGNGSQLTGISTSSNIIFNGTSNVEIATASGPVTITAGTRTWTFSTGGALDVPKFGDYEEYGRVRGNGLQLRGDTNGGGSYTNIILPNNNDGVTNALTVANEIGNVWIYANENTWEFNGNGNLTAPGNVIADTFISNEYNVLTAGNLSITSQYGLGVTGTILENGGTLELIGNGTGAGTTGCVVVGWNSSYGTAGNVAQIYLNPADSTGNIVVTTGNTAATNYQWNFDKTGNLTAPGSISTTGNITGGNVIGTTGVSVGGTGGDLTMTGGAITGVGNITSNGIMAINAPGGITTTAGSFDIVNATATTVNIGGSATAVNIGATTGTVTINNPTIVGSQTSLTLFNTTASNVSAFGAASNLIVGATSGTMTLRNPTIVGTQTTQSLFNTVATTVNFAGAATALNIGGAGNATFSANTLVRVANTSGSALSVAGNITGGNVTTTGAVYSNYNTNTANVGSFMATGGNTKGGTGYLDFLVAQNTSGGSTNPYKWLRVDSTGQLQIINSAYTQNIFNLTDAGVLTVPSPILVGGKQAVNGPAFRAYVDTGQTIVQGAQRKVTFGTETFDTNSNFASSTFTPTVEGYYQLNATVRISGTSGTGEVMLILYKNGSEYARGTNESGTEQGTNFYSMSVSDIAYANGSTDNFEIYIQQTSGGDRTTTAGSAISHFSGSMIRGA
jgi:filamentous hemagglutinin